MTAPRITAEEIEYLRGFVAIPRAMSRETIRTLDDVLDALDSAYAELDRLHADGMPRDREELQKLLNDAHRKGNQEAHEAHQDSPEGFLIGKKMKYRIPHRWNQEPCWEGEIEDQGNDAKNLGAAVLVAHKAGARLDGARLDGARLVGARLDGARLDGASLDGARLVGAILDGASLVGASLDRARLDGARLDGARLDRASLVGASLVGALLDHGEKLLANGVRIIGPIGSRSSYCTAYATDKGLRFRAGCFFGDPDALRDKVVATHGVTYHALDYEAWIAWCEAWYARMTRLPS